MFAFAFSIIAANTNICLLYTSDAADERSSVDLGGRRIIKKKNKTNIDETRYRSRIYKHHHSSYHLGKENSNHILYTTDVD